MGHSNEHHTPYWAVVVFLVISALVTAALGANDQELVLYYAVSVFMSFLVGLLAMARFSRRERTSVAGPQRGRCAGGRVHARANLARGHPIISVAAALLIGSGVAPPVDGSRASRAGSPACSPRPKEPQTPNLPLHGRRLPGTSGVRRDLGGVPYCPGVPGSLVGLIVVDSQEAVWPIAHLPAGFRADTRQLDARCPLELRVSSCGGMVRGRARHGSRHYSAYRSLRAIGRREQ